MRSATTDNYEASLEEIYAMFQAHGLTAPGERPTLIPLQGGISSEIFRADLAGGSVCVKRARRKLNVEQEWYAPLERSEAEVAWIRAVQSFAPSAAPPLIAADADRHMFVMSYLNPRIYPCWKELLRDGSINSEIAATVGTTLGEIHSQTANRSDLAEVFSNDSMFEALRIEPYLRATAAVHPDLAGHLSALAEATLSVKRVLMHGDVSPKNIAQGPDGPVFLDSECACFGDPAFDLAFCLNHLLLKSVWRPQWRDGYLECFDSLSAGYLSAVDWEHPDDLEARTAGLLSALLLARIDGKSPVEYITEESDKTRVRQIALRFLSEPAGVLRDIRNAWRAEVSS
jgi:aminoglycoside phosphotransferase (APT) family kinase protein